MIAFRQAKHANAARRRLGVALALADALSTILPAQYGIAWSGVPHDRHVPGLRMLSISSAAGERDIALSGETVQERSYPLTRNIFIYINDLPGAPVDSKVKGFLRYIMSNEGQQDVARLNIYPATYTTSCSGTIKEDRITRAQGVPMREAL